jgi:hypothetical protein
MSDHRKESGGTRYIRLLRRSREFRGLVLAQVASEVGDHFARVALFALVLDQSDSVFYAALAFVVGYIPGLFGGILLSPFADRLPRKRVLIVCDLARGALMAFLALIAIDGTPLWVLFAIMLFAQLFSQPFGAARQATVPDVLPDPQDFMAGTGLMRGLYQVNQVLGLTVAGVVVAVFTPRVALVVDALTFVVSYLFIQATLRFRPAPLEGRGGVRGFLSDTADGVRLVFGHPARRTFVLLVWSTIGFLIAPEAVAIPYARDHGADGLGGLMLAAVPAGGALGVLFVSRMEPVRAARLSPLLATGAMIPLVLTFTDPAPWLAIGLWLLSGFLQAFVIAMIVGVNLLTPTEARGRVNGLAGAGLSLFTATGFAIAGWLADLVSPAAAVGIAGVAGLAAVGLLVPTWGSASAALAAHVKPPSRSPHGRPHEGSPTPITESLG